MGKLILLLLILFSVIVPIRLSQSKSPRRTLRLIQFATVGMTLLWAYLCLNYYPNYVDVR